jgi:hypothetical protein
MASRLEKVRTDIPFFLILPTIPDEKRLPWYDINLLIQQKKNREADLCLDSTQRNIVN